MAQKDEVRILVYAEKRGWSPRLILSGSCAKRMRLGAG